MTQKETNKFGAINKEFNKKGLEWVKKNHNEFYKLHWTYFYYTHRLWEKLKNKGQKKDSNGQ